MISIIIPVYNTEKYLKACLDSVVGQTYRDIEIICIDDGSNDGSSLILDEFSKKDKRIKIITQENKGQAAARNAGVNCANGEYITFIDSDDWIDKDYIEKLYNSITLTNSDIAAASVIRVRENFSKIRFKYSEQKVYSELSDKIKACDIPRCCYACAKLFKAQLVKSMKFKEGVYYEDMLYTPQIIKKSNFLVCCPNVNYYYVVNPDSTVKKAQSDKKQLDFYNAKKFIIKFFEENNLPLNKKQKTITKKIKYFLNIPVYKIKEYENKLIYHILGIAIWQRKSEDVKQNAF